MFSYIPLLLLQLTCLDDHTEVACPGNQSPACKKTQQVRELGEAAVAKVKWICVTSGETKCLLSALMNLDQGFLLCLWK